MAEVSTIGLDLAKADAAGGPVFRGRGGEGLRAATKVPSLLPHRTHSVCRLCWRLLERCGINR